MKLLDLFAGIGGFSHGLKMAGMELVGYCEIDKHAHKAFQILHDPEERLWNEYDVRTIDPLRLPDFDAMCFGWPCQDNSIAGNRIGQRDGTRSGLLYEATRILRDKKPKYFVAENVDGLLTVNDGKDFYQTIREFTDVGYDVQWQVLDSSSYTSQYRKRIYFVGHIRGTTRPEVFPIGFDGKSAEGENTIYCFNPRQTNGKQTYQQDRVYGVSGKLPALSSQLGGRMRVVDNGKIRDLTPLEWFRLQTFPDEWYHTLKEHGISDSQLYKMAGNAVTSRVAYEIGKRIMGGAV